MPLMCIMDMQADDVHSLDPASFERAYGKWVRSRRDNPC